MLRFDHDESHNEFGYGAITIVGADQTVGVSIPYELVVKHEIISKRLKQKLMQKLCALARAVRGAATLSYDGTFHLLSEWFAVCYLNYRVRLHS